MTDAPVPPAPEAAKPDAPAPVSDEALLARFQNASRRPPASETMGFRMVRVEQAKMELEIEFEGAAAFTNPAGQIQGGFLCAMLDEAMSVSGVVASGMTAFVPTLEMKTSFFRPAAPGKLYVVARVRKWGRTIAFLEGELYDAGRRLIATASSTAMPRPYKSIQRPEA